jgi:oligopeptide transport system substrate-binding protein
MSNLLVKQICALLVLIALALTGISCQVTAGSEPFFGKTVPPERNILRYVTGDEPESLDPVVSTGQPEARIYMALYDGLVEYHPKTSEPIPGVAESWEVNKDSSEFIFHLRQNARWSNGDPITAHDFVFSIRRALAKETASRNAYIGSYIKNAVGYTGGKVFVRDPQTGQFLLTQDFNTSGIPVPLSIKPVNAGEPEFKTAVPDSTFHQSMHSPERLAVPKDEKARAKEIGNNEKLKAAIAGKELVPIRAEDLGVEAVNDYTLRISLSQSAPFFVSSLAHQVFRLVSKKAVEKYGDKWTQQQNIITCGPFKVKTWQPYDKLVVEKDPMYWDAASVKLDEIHFFPMSDNPTIMNLYKVGEVDAVLNHSVPNAWLDVVRTKKDYMDGVEAAIDYLQINVTKAPMNDVRVRKAFNHAIDKEAWARWKRIIKPLTAFTPKGIFKDYPQPEGDKFDPERARQLLGEAGYPVVKNADGSFSCPKFPADKVEYIYNTQESNKSMAEWMQAQWKQNLGITITLRNMEWKTFLETRAKLEYNGFSRAAWSADYMDPFTYLCLFYTNGESGTGWEDPKFVRMVDEANSMLDHKKRYELLAKAEKYMIDAQPVIPLDTASVNWVKKPYVKGMYPNATSLFPWKYVYIERDQAKWDHVAPSLAE